MKWWEILELYLFLYPWKASPIFAFKREIWYYRNDMQIHKNLKHILIISSLSLALIFWVLRFSAQSFSLPLTHFFIYRENVSALNWLYKYTFAASKDIVIINIDDTTLNSLQAESDLKMLRIPKSIYRNLVESLESVWVKGIAFDIVFQNADLWKTSDGSTEEEKFAQTLVQYPNIVIATTNGKEEKCYKDTAWTYETCDGKPRSVYKDAKLWYIGIAESGDRKIVVQDISNIAGKEWLEVDTLSLALYKTNIDIHPTPFIKGESVLTPFFWPAGTYPSISLSEVLAMPKVQKVSNFAGKYVFIGESGTIIHDQFISPVSGTFMDWVEFHAHFLDGILQSRYLQWYSILDPIFVVFIIWFLVTMSIIYLLSPKQVGILVAFFITLLILWISRYLYFRYAVVIEILPMLLAGSVFTFPITFIYRFFIVDRERRMIIGAFAHYLDPELVKEIADNADSIKLGGESRELSVLFSDIAGFTTISEKTPVKELFMLMSNYLSRMTGILISQWGTLDKYIWDAVMGFFWAPLIQEDHARRACQTALDMREALPAFNEWLKSQSLEPIDFRIGIGSGEVMVWNIWSEDRFSYTVLGDTVNLASRLEAISKEYGTHIIVSEGTYMMTKELFLFRKLDLITVKGKDTAVGIYELIADIRDKTIDTMKYDQYEQALGLYVHWEYLRAGKIWESQFEVDPPSRTMAHRCLDILKGELIVEDGVYHMTKK